MLVIKNWQYWVWPTFPTSKPSKSAFAFHEEKKHLLCFPHSFLRTFKYHLAAAFTEPGRISGISFRKIAWALQSAGLYIGRAEQRATSENARRSPRPHLTLLPGFFDEGTLRSDFLALESSSVHSWRLGTTWQSAAPGLVSTRTRTQWWLSSSYIYPVAGSVALRSVWKTTKLPSPTRQAVWTPGTGSNVSFACMCARTRALSHSHGRTQAGAVVPRAPGSLVDALHLPQPA